MSDDNLKAGQPRKTPNVKETPNPEGGPVGNLKAQKHGAEGAIKRIQSGQPFTGLAAEAEREVRAQLEITGRISIMFDDAARLQTVANLYFEAMRKAFEEGNFEKIDKVVSRYGWLATAALRAWSAVGLEEEKAKGGAIDAATILESLKGGNDGTDNA